MANGKLHTLVPFDIRESMSLREAAMAAGKTPRTMRNWCIEKGIGRLVGKTWLVSRVALQMYLDGDTDSLVSYRDHGVRASYPPVAEYFRRTQLGELLDLPGFQD
jgi:hypothetical protein